MKLKITFTEHAVTATEKWYRIATDYKLAIGIYYDRYGGQAPTPKGTGFLVKGGSLHDKWKDQIVFLTASHVVQSSSQGGSPDFSQIYLMFPGLDGAIRLRVERVLFESRELDVAVLRLSGKPPLHALPVEFANQAEAKEPLEGIAVLHWTANDGFSLGFGHGISKPTGGGLPAGWAEHANRKYYTHVTGGGASGAPVFDASSGNVVCLHQVAVARGPRPFGGCTSISAIVAAIAAS